MPKGRHKGARRQFTDFDAEQARLEREAKQASWRAQRGEIDSDEEAEKGSDKEEDESETESSSSEEEEEAEDTKERKAKGVSALIECENPNRAGGKATKKVSELGTDSNAGKPQLSRREREEVEKQRAAAHYRKMHAQGKTEEARSDLERLALIRAKRAEAELKRKEQQEAKSSKGAGAKSTS